MQDTLQLTFSGRRSCFYFVQQQKLKFFCAEMMMVQRFLV